MDAVYKEVIDDLLCLRILDRCMSILVVCGGHADKEVLYTCGFRHVVISNVDGRMTGKEFAPFEWSFQHAENLAFDDNSFDFCIVHSGLHHCYSPHRALLEMYRVARKGILVCEPHDNFLTRMGVLFSVGQEYEHAAVFYNDCSCGGVENSSIPNYVYRWTAREIAKTIRSFYPCGKHRFRFIYKMRIPWTQLKGRKRKIFYYGILLLLPFLKVMNLVFPRQCNHLVAVVLKPKLPDELFPWLFWREGGAGINETWLAKRYGKSTSGK